MNKYFNFALIICIVICSVITIIGIGLTAGGNVFNTITRADIIQLRGSEKIIHYPGNNAQK